MVHGREASIATVVVPMQQEARVFEDAFIGPQLSERWRWLHEDPVAWEFAGDCLEMRTVPGCLLGSQYHELPMPPLLLCPLSDATAFEVTVTMPPDVGSTPAQAGLFWYIDKQNFGKLVVDVVDGSCTVSLAREVDGHPQVIATVELDEEEASQPTRLRLELSADRQQISGVIVGAYYMRLVGSIPLDGGSWDAAGLQEHLVGISAFGCDTEVAAARCVQFAKFVLLAVKSNRVQWAGGAGFVPSDFVAQPEPLPAQAGYAPPAPGEAFAGLTLSKDLSDEQRAAVAMLLAGVSNAN